jgi:hypothetical protein
VLAAPSEADAIARALELCCSTPENGVLEASDGRSRRLPAPVRGDDATISGDGWTFKAGAGWVIREGARKGDYVLAKLP